MSIVFASVETGAADFSGSRWGGGGYRVPITKAGAFGYGFKVATHVKQRDDDSDGR